MRLNLLSVAAAVLPVIHAISTEDAFHIDYHQALLGLPQSDNTFFHKPQSSSNASLLYTISDKAVLGAVNPKDGSLLWRQTLGSGFVQNAKNTYLVTGSERVVISGFEETVSAWDALDGRLDWDFSLAKDTIVKGLQAVPQLGGTGENVVQDVIVLAGPSGIGSGATLSRVGGGSQGAIWEYKDSSASLETFVSISTTAKHVYYISRSFGLLSSAKAKVVVINIDTGAEISQHNVATDAEPLGAVGSYAVGSCSESPFLVSSEKPYKSFKVNLLGNTKVSTLSLEDKGEEVESLAVHHACHGSSAPHFLVHVKTTTKQWAEIFHINPKTGDAKKAYSLPATGEKSAFVASVADDTVYFARVTETEILLYSSESHGQIGRWSTITGKSGSFPAPLHAVVEVSARGKSGLAIRAAISTEVGEWTLYRNGDQQWTRPENLAYITKAVWSEDVDSVGLAQDIEAEVTANPLSAYIHRVVRHIQGLTSLPAALMELPTTLLQAKNDTGLSIRQQLVGGKLALVATSHQTLLALDITASAATRWSIDLAPHTSPNSVIVELFVNDIRLTAYLSDGSFAVVDIVKGELLEFMKGTKSFDKVLAIPGSLASTIIKVSADGTPSIFDNLAPASPVEGSAIVTINDKGEAVGWSVGSSIERLWTIRPEGSTRIVSATSRPARDPVASIGKVLGDRSVLYKYVDPNLALLTALSSTGLTMYLINAVTGSVLHTAKHEGVLHEYPVASVMSENWFAYSLTSQDASTSGVYTELIIAELYESDVSNDRGLLSSRTNYSAFSADAGAKPHVISQSFTVAEPISNLTVSQTLQGITTRQILAYLPFSQAIVSIPREILNARRPVDRDPTGPEMEEGLVKYAPILDLDPKNFLTHSRHVLGIQALMSAPTLLESTSIIFSYGHDVFGTQVAPSNTFDVLGKSFNKFQLVLTVVALYAGVLALRPLVRKRMVEGRWL